MSDVHNATQSTETTNPEPLGNSTEARTPDGTLKDSTQPLIQPSEKKDDATTKTDEKVEAKKEDAKEGAPEKYEAFKAPEGKEVSADLVTKFEPVARELNLNQEQAQKLVDLWNEQAGSVSERLDQMVMDQRNAWRAEIAKDKTLGNGTDNLSDASKKSISDAISAIGDEKAQTALKEALDQTGAGDHPKIVAAFVALGKLVGEGSVVKGGGPAKTGQNQPGKGAPSAAQAMYPNLPSSAG